MPRQRSLETCRVPDDYWARFMTAVANEYVNPEGGDQRGGYDHRLWEVLKSKGFALKSARDWFSGRRRPNWGTFVTLCAALGVDMNWVVYGTVASDGDAGRLYLGLQGIRDLSGLPGRFPPVPADYSIAVRAVDPTNVPPPRPRGRPPKPDDGLGPLVKGTGDKLG
jgi:hypothetical protein